MTAFRFCPSCTSPLVPDAGAVCLHCRACGFRHYREPKVSVIGRISHGNRLLLIQRAVEPGLGQWGFPGGFLNVDEMPAQALVREVQEETGVQIEVQALLDIFPMEGRGPGIPGLVLAYAAVCASDPDQARAGDDARCVRWCRHDQIPAPVAFRSTRRLLAQWQAQFGPEDAVCR